MTKWDELVEVAARGAYEHARESSLSWEGQSIAVRDLHRLAMDTALRALLAKGIKFVPGEPTYRMQEAAVFCDSDRWPTVIKAAIDAGSIKPEGE